MEKVLRAEKLTHTYSGGDPVIEDVSLSLSRGELYGVVGPNGSGKTTLLKILGGIIKPLKGHVEIRGKVGYVPQQIFVEEHFPATVKELITAVGGRASYDVLAQLHLHTIWDKRFVDLSGGQKKIVLIGMALSIKPSVLLLDEPTAELDVHFRKHILVFLKELSRQGTAVLMVSHDINFILTNADRVMVLCRKVEFEGSPTKAGEAVKRVFGMGVTVE